MASDEFEAFVSQLALHEPGIIAIKADFDKEFAKYDEITTVLLGFLAQYVFERQHVWTDAVRKAVFDVVEDAVGSNRAFADEILVGFIESLCNGASSDMQAWQKAYRALGPKCRKHADLWNTANGDLSLVEAE